MTLLPIGVLQVKDSFVHGIWFAGSADFYNKTAVLWLGDIRAIPDLIIIIVGVLPLTAFLFMTYRHLKSPKIVDGESVLDKAGISIADV